MDAYLDSQKMASAVLSFQQATFNNTYSTMNMFQDQTERMVNTFLEQVPGLPLESKKMLQGWMENCKKARDEYKKTIEEAFKNLETHFGESSKTES